MNNKDNGKAQANSDKIQSPALLLSRITVTVRTALAGALVFSAALPALAQAAEQPRNSSSLHASTSFSIPAGSLSNALQTLANEANVMLIFTPEQTRNKTSTGLQGQYSVEAAFQQLLAGSGLQAVNEGGSYRLINSNESSTEDTFVVPELSVVSGLDDSVVAGRSTLKKENIERIQADNVAALLDKLPGVSSAGSPRPGGQSLNIWGMGGMEDIKITLDGAPKGFEKYRQGSVFIEPELIKQIDVDKGPFNLANGNGGFGGSIKIVTKDASDLLQEGENFGGMAKYSFHTNDNQSIYSGALYGRTEEGFADGLLYMSKRDGGDIMRPTGTRFAYSANKQGTYLAKTNLYLTDAQTLTLSAMYSDADGWQPFAAKRDEMAAPSQADIDKYGYEGAWRRKLVYRKQQDENYSVKWNLAPADNPWIDLTLNYAYSKTKQNDTRPDNAATGSYLGSLGNESWVDYTDNLIEGSNKSRFTTGPIDHLLEVGMSWHHNKRNTLMYYPSYKNRPEYNYGFFQPAYMPAGEAQTTSLYIQDSMTLGSVTVTPGIRYDNVLNEGQQNVAEMYNSNDPTVGHDYSSKRYTGLTPALGLVWKATPNISLFADVTRTWRAPTIDEQYTMQYALSNVSGTSRNLKVEKINSVRGGVILNYDNVLTDEDRVQVRTTVFRNRGKGEIFLRRGILCEERSNNAQADCGSPLSNYRNLPGYTIQGLEIESFYDSQRMFGSLSFSTISGERDASPRDPWGNKTWIPEIPPTTVHTTLGVKIPEFDMALGWTTDLVRKQDRSPIEGDPLAGVWALPATKGYALQGLFATWQPRQVKGLEARVAVDNLFNTNYYPYLGESVSGVGRNIKLSISQKF